ncbi:hypothetical protein HY030_03495 [Candidatus Gottesmanbacteria bacterium]|nr:hypothetical protein [Candidatus Gottesmanbacteria bacterium]
MKKVILGLSLLGGALVLSGCYHNKTQSLNTQTATEVTATNTPAATESMEKKTEVIVKMTASGFVPSKVTVKLGTSVKFVNVDTVDHWPASAIHPTHQLLPGFDALMGIKPGESYSFTFEKVGIWKYHDHLNPSMMGSVEVTEK